MKYPRLHLLILTAGALLAIALHCAMISPNESSSIGGTGSEVVGVVEYPDSSAAAKRSHQFSSTGFALAGGSVFINPRDHLAKPSGASEKRDTTTDDSGYFHIKNVLGGEHLIYIRDSRGNSVAHIVSVPDEPRTIYVGKLIARKNSGVSIAYTGPAPDKVLFYVDVEGTDIQLKCENRNVSFTLDGIPTGEDVKHTIIVRMFEPVERSYEFPAIKLLPGVIETLQSITGD
jgi:hypothetical protein